MGKMMLVTGGARSGKSSYAESLLRKMDGDIMYIATAIPFDDEMKDRIKKHKQQRPDTWHTYEGHKELYKVVAEQSCNYVGVLLDCVTILVTNLMFDYMGEKDIEDIDIDSLEKSIYKEFELLVNSIKRSSADVVLVTNELGCGVVPESKLGRVFRDIAGRMNQYLGRNADEVYLSVCGIPTKIK